MLHALRKHPFTGFPIVTAETAQKTAELLLDDWVTKGVYTLWEFLERKDITEDQKATARKYAPVIEVVHQDDPNGEDFVGTRVRVGDWGMGICLLDVPDLPLPPHLTFIAEQKHGVHPTKITYSFPAGGVAKVDLQGDPSDGMSPMLRCIKREFEEETGIEADRVLLMPRYPRLVSGRSSTQRATIARVYPRYTPMMTQQLDRSEFVQVMHITIPEWRKFLRIADGVEMGAESATYHLLDELGHIF